MELRITITPFHAANATNVLLTLIGVETCFHGYLRTVYTEFPLGIGMNKAGPILACRGIKGMYSAMLFCRFNDKSSEEGEAIHSNFPPFQAPSLSSKLFLRACGCFMWGTAKLIDKMTVTKLLVPSLLSLLVSLSGWAFSSVTSCYCSLSSPPVSLSCPPIYFPDSLSSIYIVTVNTRN